MSKGCLLGVAGIVVLGFVGAGTWAVLTANDDPTPVVVEDVGAVDATDDAADTDETDTDATDAAPVLDANGNPAITREDLAGTLVTANGDVTLFGAMDAALLALAPEADVPPYYPVTWAGQDCDPDGSADLWFFNMANTQMVGDVLDAVRVARDGTVEEVTQVDRETVGLACPDCLGSYPPRALDSTALWAASPHPVDCPAWIHRTVTYYWQTDGAYPVVVFSGQDDACFPGEPLWLSVDPYNGDPLD